MKEDHTSLLIDYLDGLLEEEERKDLEVRLDQSEVLRNELKELSELMDQTVKLPLSQPGSILKHQFYQFLEAEKKQVKSSSSLFRLSREQWTIAATVALLVVGLGFGTLWQRNQHHQDQINNLQAEVESTRQMLMLAMLQQSSASERIKALNAVLASVEQNEFSGEKEKILDALVYSMNFDDNINVRMKAAESLASFSDQPQVVEALIESLKTQESPEVQIIIIEILTEAKARGAAGEFQNLMKEENTHEVVRQKAAYGIEILL